MKMGRKLGIDGFFFKNCKVGDVFYTKKINKHIGMVAKNHKVKVKTEIIVAIESIGKKPPIAYNITKVIIVKKD